MQDIYDRDLGYGIHSLGDNLEYNLKRMIEKHLDIPHKIENTREVEQILLEHFSKTEDHKTRSSRTINEEVMKHNKEMIIEELSKFLPRPKRLHNDDLYCRIVIPGQDNTISVPHRDKYFHDITPGWQFDDNEMSIKLWFPIINISGVALGIVPGSHKECEKDYAKFYSENGEMKFSTPHKQEELSTVQVNVGECLLFPDLLIHGSLKKNKLDGIRISGELTLVYDKVGFQ